MSEIRGGYMGSILDIDLTSGEIGSYPIRDEDLRDYLGGKILAARILWDLLEPGIDPFSPDNVLVFTAGALNGSNLPSTSRFNCSTKNPLTYGVATSNCGGDFGMWLRKAGHDGMIVRGRAASPVRIDVTEEGVEINDASELWGQNIEAVQRTLGKKTREVVIGPAGENLVRFACALSGDRALGRCGIGAVMGSKNLKLITATGKQKLPVANRDGLKALARSWVKQLKDHPVTGTQLPNYGTAGLINPTNATHTLTTRNFQKGQFEHADDISGETLAETRLKKNGGCRTCPIRCGRVVEREGEEIKGPEYETLGMFGASMNNRSLERIIEWNYLADVLGMDTITLGSTLACAMELHERGLLPDLEISFDDHEGVAKLIEDVAYRRGMGAALADGSARLAESCGAPGLSMSTKGLEFAAYEPRGAVGHGLGYAVSNRGGCHINGGYLVYFEALGAVNMDPLTPKAKPGFTVFQQNMFEVISAVGNCIFTSYAIVPDTPAWLYDPKGASARIVGGALLAARVAVNKLPVLRPGMLPIHAPGIPQSNAVEVVTGMRCRLGDLLEIGDRGYNLERMINVREGLLGETDTLPPRLTDEPERPDVPESKVPLDQMLPVYYRVRRWDRDGIPKAKQLRKLGLDFTIGVADEVRERPDAFRERRNQLLVNEDDNLAQALAAIGTGS